MSHSPSSAGSIRKDKIEKDVVIELNSMSDLEQQPAPAPKPAGPPANDLYQPRSLKFWGILLCNFLALFLVALDRTIVATAVPRITDEFKSLGDIGWYGSAYMLTTSSAQLIFGRIYKFYDMKLTFLISIVVFEIGSAICGAAPSSAAFIAGRAVAGFASAGIFSGCMLVMIPMIPLHKRPMFQGVFGMIFGVASVLGPVIGGGFTGALTWRWCFYINLPIGAVSLLFMILFWNPPKQTFAPASVGTHIKRLDPLGMFFFLPALVSLLLALQWGGSTYNWNDGRIIALFVVFGVGILAFAAVQILKPETATVPPKVIMQRSVFFGTVFMFFLAGSMLMMIFYIPIWFQTVKLVDPLQSGIYTLPFVLAMVVSSIMSGGLTAKIGYYVPAMLFAPILMSVGDGLMSTFNRDTDTSRWVGYQFLSGFGLGAAMQTVGLAMQTVLPKPEVPIGIALMFFTQQLGGAVFTSVAQTILSNLLVSELSGIPGLQASDIVNEGATNLGTKVPAEFMGLVISAYNFALTRIFLTAMGLAFGALLSAFGMEWRSIKKGKNGQDGPGGPGGPPGPPGPPTGAVKHEGSAKAASSSEDTAGSLPAEPKPREQ